MSDVQSRAPFMRIEEIAGNFEVLDDWEDRYRYLIELGRELEPLRDEERNASTKVRGCASQVWIVTAASDEGGLKRIYMRGESDAHIVRGLVAVVLAIYSGKTAEEILALDETAIFVKLGLNDHLTPQRSNGLASMVARIKHDAKSLAAASPGAATSGLPQLP